MPIRVTCPNCRKIFNAPDNYAGKIAKCSGCGGRIAIAAAAVDPFDPLDVLDEGPRAAPPPLAPAAPPRETFASPPPRSKPVIVRSFVCADCGSYTDGKKVTPGSFLIEVILWLFMLLPGVIYSIWRLASKHNACTVCGGKNLVPSSSPRGRELAQRIA